MRTPALMVSRNGSVAALVLFAGCYEPAADVGDRPEAGLVYLFPGIDGLEWEVQRAHDALRDAGVASEIRVFDWQSPFDPLENLTDEARNRQLAAGVAEELHAFQREYPAAPIDLVGYSGGGGIALFAVEALSDAVRVRRIVLVQSAVSPRYDLSRALTRVSDALVNFYSSRDWLILGVGTSVFGTIDRSFTASAGSVGFVVEAAVPRAAQRTLLRQVEWTEAMRRTGHWGGHLSIGAYDWNRSFVAPLVGGAAEDPAARD